MILRIVLNLQSSFHCKILSLVSVCVIYCPLLSKLLILVTSTVYCMLRCFRLVRFVIHESGVDPVLEEADQTGTNADQSIND